MTILTYNGHDFTQRETDGYLNATQMCQVDGKLIADWIRTKDYARYTEALSASMGIPINELVISKSGQPANGGGTWIHPKLAIKLARWISVDFELWCDEHIETLITTGSTTIQEVEIPKPISHTAVEYAHAAVAVESLPNNLLKQLVRDALIDELSLQQNLKYLPVAEKPKKYTIVKVRAKELGYSHQQIGDGKMLGKFVKSQVEPAFQEYIGKYPVFHYEVNDAFDRAIHLFFS